MGEETKPLESSTIPPGHYTLENLSDLIGGLFPSLYILHLLTKTNTGKTLLEIKKESEQKIRFGPDFAKLIGIDDDPLKKNSKRKMAQISIGLLHSL